MIRSWKRHTVAMLFVMLMAMLIAPQVQAAEHWKTKYVRLSATAGETLATGDVVYIKGSDGKAYKADANDSAKRPAVGVIGKGGASSAKVEIVRIGVLGGQTAASPGARLFLSETPNTLTTTAPTNAQAMGWVMPGTTSSSTTYFIQAETPTSAGAGY